MDVSQVVHGRVAAPAAKAAERNSCLYDVVWQVGEPIVPDLARAPPVPSHRVTWQADVAGQQPRRMALGRTRAKEVREVYPAREALRSVAWLQAAVHSSQPGSAITLRTCGSLSFPQLLEPPGDQPLPLLAR